MAMVYLTDRKLDNHNSIDNNNNSSAIKEKKKIQSSKSVQSYKNIDNMVLIPKVKVPFNSHSKGHNFLGKLNRNPGPGAYNVENDFVKPQINALENMNFMANSPRFINENKGKESNPGPGSYNLNGRTLFQKKLYNRPNSNKLNYTYRYNSINSVSSIPSKNHNYGYLENEEGELIQAIIPVNEDYFSGEKNNCIGPGR